MLSDFAILSGEPARGNSTSRSRHDGVGDARSVVPSFHLAFATIAWHDPSDLEARSIASGISAISGAVGDTGGNTLSNRDLLDAVLTALRIASPVLLFGGIVALLAVAVGLWKQRRITQSGIRQIDGMTGLEFERYLGWLFRRLGYHITRTPYQGDYGADLVATKDGVKIAIQAKRSKRRIGIKAVQQAFASTGLYDCERSMVVTNAFFTQQAIDLAKADRVELWDRNRLMIAMASIGGRTTVNEALAPPGQRSIEAPVPDERLVGTAALAVCAICGQPVSDRVRDYCVANANKFGGSILCWGHQRELGAKSPD